MSTAALAGRGRAELKSRARRIAIVHLSQDDNSVSENGSSEWRAFFSELHQRGYAEGHNLIVDRYAVKPSSFVDTGPDAAVAIVSREPEVIVVTSGGWARRIRIATTRIPIVAMTADPIGEDLVASVAQPSGNITGVATDPGPTLLSKQLEFLLEAAPDCSHIACVGATYTKPGMRSLWRDANARGVSVQEFLVYRQFRAGSTRDHYANAFAAMLREGARGVLMFDNIEHLYEFNTIAELALRHRLPLISPFRQLTEAGGLMSYGPNWAALERRRATYVSRILDGGKPADLPFEQPTEFELVLNRSTAEALGRPLPASLMAFADEVVP